MGRVTGGRASRPPSEKVDVPNGGRMQVGTPAFPAKMQVGTPAFLAKMQVGTPAFPEKAGGTPAPRLFA